MDTINNRPPETMSPSQRLAEIADLLARGITRRIARYDEQRRASGFCLDSSGTQSVHANQPQPTTGVVA